MAGLDMRILERIGFRRAVGVGGLITISSWSLLLILLLVPVPALGNGDHQHSRKEGAEPATAGRPSQVGAVRWTDDRGRVHYSQGMDSVPKQFRSRAVPLGQRGPSSPRR